MQEQRKHLQEELYRRRGKNNHSIGYNPITFEYRDGSRGELQKNQDASWDRRQVAKSTFIGLHAQSEYNPITGVDAQWAHLPVSTRYVSPGMRGAGKPARSGLSNQVRSVDASGWTVTPGSRRRAYPQHATTNKVISESEAIAVASRGIRTNFAVNYESMSRERGGAVPTIRLDSPDGIYEVPSKSLLTPLHPSLPIVQKPKQQNVLPTPVLHQPEQATERSSMPAKQLA